MFNFLWYFSFVLNCKLLRECTIIKKNGGAFLENKLLERVRNTRNEMRVQQLFRIFEDFDKECMQLDTQDRQEKYAKMVESPFRFFRGSAYLFYSDMMKIPSIFHTSDERPIWIMGDMHMDNFGAFQNEKGQIVYDVNDFDEGYVGSYLFEVMRMSVSIALYMEEQKISTSSQEKAIRQFLSGYLKQLRRFKQKKDDPSTLIFNEDNTKGPIKKVLKKLKNLQQTHLLEDITEVDEVGNRTFILSEEIQPVSEKEYEDIVAALPAYTIKDMVYKFGSGTASIGLKRYYILVTDRKGAHGENDLILEMKEVRTAIPAYFLPYNEQFWAAYEHQGARVVGTQRAMHHLEDPYLEYLTMDGKEFYVRERSPYKKKVKPKNYKEIDDYYDTTFIMGKIAAKIHARADKDYSDAFKYHAEKEILAAIGNNERVFIDTVVHNALAYKDMVNQDYQVFKNWMEKNVAVQETIEIN